MKISTIALVSFAFISFSCSKSRGKGPQVVPTVLFMVIKTNGVRLDDNNLNTLKLFYFKNGVKTYLSDFMRGVNEGGFNAFDLGVQGTRKIGDISADENIKDYYLEFQNGDIDTLFVNYRHLNENDAFSNSCYCYYPLEQLKFNGTVCSPDSTITQQKVYKFDKP